MSQINKWLRENFGYSKKEINGSIILLFIISVVFLGVYALDYYRYASNEYSSEKDLELLDNGQPSSNGLKTSGRIRKAPGKCWPLAIWENLIPTRFRRHN